MNIEKICILLSSISFFAYVASYFLYPHMKNEFKRFNIDKLGLLIIILELFGAMGLLIGLKFNLILIISSVGLALLMLSGLVIRIKSKDSFWISFPALFYLCLNAYIFLGAIK